jgi:hypothetical protein
MSRRIDIELTSSSADGTWTWRAAGAREPRGSLDGALLPDGSKPGDVLKVEAEFDVDGITVLSVVTSSRHRREPERLELIVNDRDFQPVTQTRAPRSERPRRDRGPRPDGDHRRPRPEGEPGARRGDGPRREGDRGDRRERGDRADRGDRRDRPEGGRRERPPRPSFTPPPELPQRPKPKRLKPGRAHRTEVLAGLPEEQRPVAEQALRGGMPAVRKAIEDENARRAASGEEPIPSAGLLKMAEELLPRLRVAEWLDRADAAKATLAELDLRDLRSVVASAEDPVVVRDESTRALAVELKQGLATRQEQALAEWLEDITAALDVGRVIRALKLSSEPPKAGAIFPAELAGRLAQATSENLVPESTADRWSAVLEAAAFSPARAAVVVGGTPDPVSDELRATVTRLAPALPQVAAAFGVEVRPGAPMPRPLRMRPERKPAGKGNQAG